GPHANGFSLVRRVIEKAGDFSDEEIRSLLAPTRLYHQEVAALRSAGVAVHAMAHITGGGLPENLERLLGGRGAALSIPEWTQGAVPKLMHYVDREDVVNTLNMGFGWVAAVAPADAEAALAAGRGARILGEVGERGAITVEVVSV
ncbi:MAG: AIR synthase-related protein, partial [Verrucomicrobiales bacterium]